MNSQAADIEADVLKYEAWVKKHAALNKGPFEYDDMCSEGMLAMWVARKKWDPASGVKASTWMMQATLWHWQTIRKSGRLTGSESRKGLRSGTHHAYVAHETSYDFSFDYGEDWTSRSYAHPIHRDGALDLVYHHKEIRDAIDYLTPLQKRYVIARFWADMRSGERRALLGSAPESIWSRAKPQLGEALAHLADMA